MAPRRSSQALPPHQQHRRRSFQRAALRHPSLSMTAPRRQRTCANGRTAERHSRRATHSPSTSRRRTSAAAVRITIVSGRGSHTGHRPFQCSVCHQHFSEAATLAQHMRRHTQEKPYVCDFPGCGKAFAIAGALTIHKRIHNGSKPFKCTYCDRAFSESSNLSKHLPAMAIETQQSTPAQPELTIFHRVGTIPLVADSLNTIHSTLINNPYTRTPYTAAQEISKSALSYTEPIQKRLAPILTKADDLANKGLDAVESRYPYPFQTPTEEIFEDLKGRSDHAKDVANKTIDEKVRTPAFQVAQGIDQKFAPIVDYFAVAVNKLHPNGTADKPAETPEGQFQYQRAYSSRRSSGTSS
ncbi:hypothetical protein NUW54_g13104 [Trametes sanguinea]|uniref:Uncharacterized protein n=1 Tax=Trametes sanguinea TaxID=158606 RepID=A0ACC1MPE6_9APHY|nr:hypothetical protein NUW54_g13104 [Trametes sanguinea]